MPRGKLPDTDKRERVRQLLLNPEWADKSGRWIAELAGVSPYVVAIVRRELGAGPSVEAIIQGWSVRTRAGRSYPLTKLRLADLAGDETTWQAGQLLDVDREYKTEVQRLRRDAFKLLGRRRIRPEGDCDGCPGLDDATMLLMEDYAELLGNDPLRAEEKLFNLLANGRPPRLTAAEAVRRVAA